MIPIKCVGVAELGTCYIFCVRYPTQDTSCMGTAKVKQEEEAEDENRILVKEELEIWKEGGR